MRGKRARRLVTERVVGRTPREAALSLTSDARQHLRITLIAFAFVLVNGPQLARVGHYDATPLFVEITTDPGTVTSRFQHHERAGVTSA